MSEARSRSAVRAVVTGAVQGVGFRHATRRRALGLGVAGWVRNGDDGNTSTGVNTTISLK